MRKDGTDRPRFDFEKVRYRRPSSHSSAAELRDLIGFDSEAYPDGQAFLFCTSRGDIWGPLDLPAALFSRELRGRHFIVYNLKYESGAILQRLPVACLRELRRKTKTTHDGYTYKYYPHKFLRISRGKNSVTFWDIFPFFQCSLEKASQKHLGEGKSPIDPKKFTREFVVEHFDKIADYCKRDAVLTARLCEFRLKEFSRYGLKPATLYSQASVSYKYIKERAGIVDVADFWETARVVLRFACSAYGGGKFEITSRGKFNGAAYDIDSAYPYEIANLKDIRGAEIHRYETYAPDADYAFIRCRVSIPSELPHPVIYRIGSTCVYPAGEWTTTLTKTEYEWLIANGAKVKVIEGYYIYCTRAGNPYAKVMRELHTIKADKSRHDDAFRDTAKKFMNGFYGKMVQLTEQPDKTLRAGPGWNPIYGAIITANVRVKLAECQRVLGPAALAVHTDGVISTKPLPSHLMGEGMGGMGLKKEGDGVIIACGIYEHDGKCANRGFEMSREFHWSSLLREMGARSSIEVPETRVTSWLAAIHQDKPEDINLFKNLHRKFDVNCDTKRLWLERATGASLLRRLEPSVPRVIIGG